MAFRAPGASSTPHLEVVRSDDMAADAYGHRLVWQVRKVRFQDVDSGRFIAEGVPAGIVPALPAHLAHLQPSLVSGVTVLGTSPTFVANDQVGHVLECRGRWIDHELYGLQFDVLYVNEQVPTTPDALKKYLGSGKFPGIGPAIAKEMIGRWGVDVLNILDNDPDRLAEINGLTPVRVAKILAAWKEKRSRFALTAFLGSHGIGESKAMKVIDELGDTGDLETKIRANPYLLTTVDGIGFRTADQVAMSLGVPQDSPVRIEAALAHILNDATQQQGHTAISDIDWLRKAAGELGYTEEMLRPYCQALLDNQTVVLRTLPVRAPGTSLVQPRRCVSLYTEALKEHRVARNLERLRKSASQLDADAKEMAVHYIQSADRGLDPSQQRAVLAMVDNASMIMTGGPGTGKTTTLRAAVELFKRQGLEVVLAAPTGRAAKRMEEAIGHTASTMHRCLEYKPHIGFGRNASNPLNGQVFIVDEASMIDTTMASAWLSALPDGGRMIWVGDADQLPSVGSGDVLRNLIESGHLPVARLTRVHRQAEGSGIAWNAQRILQGASPGAGGDPWVDDFAFVSANTADQVIDQIKELVAGFQAAGVPPQSIQVLSPQRTGALGVSNLNHELRWFLNPKQKTPIPPEDCPKWLEGDRVMQTKNNYDLEVFNGDMGTIVKIGNDESLVVEMEGERKVTFSKVASRGLQMGYAITVHKSQGGERPVIVMVCSSAHTFMLNQNLLYTGVTRGRDKVVLVGDPRAAFLAVRKHDEQVRTTGLVHEINRVMAQASPQPPPARAPARRP